MKKLIVLVIATMMIPVFSYSQVRISATEGSPDASAMLDVQSTTSGLLIPRMTTTERTGIGSPAEGLMVYDTDLGRLCFYRSGVWRQDLLLDAGGASASQVAFWSSSGVLSGNNNLYWNNTSARLGIGTASPNQQLELTGSFRFPATTASTVGVIYKAAAPFIHNYNPTGKVGANTFIGEYSGNFSMNGTNSWESSYNTATGQFTLNDLTTGYYNTAVGAFALADNTSGYNNTGIGTNVLYLNTIGYSNTAVGTYVLTNNTSGYFNTGIGSEVLFDNTIGIYNTAVGAQALTLNKTGADNTAVGKWALEQDTVANGNTAVGSAALDNYVNGNYNTAVGYMADVNATELTNTVSIGYNAIAQASNQVRLGNASIQSFFCKGAWNSTSASLPNMVVDVNGQIMQSTATIPSGSSTVNRVAYWSSTGVLGGSDLLFWDITNSRLGVNTSSPSQRLEVRNGNILLSNSATAGEMRFAEPAGSNFTAFKAQAQSADLTYTLPASISVDGAVLSTTSSGTLSWITPNAGDITAVGSMSSGAVFADATATGDWLGLGSSAGRIVFSDQTTDYVNIINAYVGIGTSTPSQQLEITGNLEMPVTTATTGIIYSATLPFLHNFGVHNVFLGELAGNLTLSGALNNTGIGDSTLYGLGGGDYNVAIGASALRAVTEGDGHVVIGTRAGMSITDPTSGGYSTIIGFQAGKYTTADRNTFIGCESGMYNTTGIYNVFLGHQSGYHNTTGNYSTALGYRALFTQTGYTSDNALNNTAVGYEAMYTTNPISSTGGRENVAVGYQALKLNQTGYKNTSVGSQALFTNTIGWLNTAVGTYALYLNSTGKQNTAVGSNALYTATTSYNTALGDGALQFMSTGQRNTAVGTYALDQLVSGSDNTAIGYMANCNESTCSNSIVIGYAASASSSDEVRLGNTSMLSLYCFGAYNGIVGATNRDLYVDSGGKIGYASSSARYKENVSTMDDIEWLYRLRPVNFTYISDETGRNQYGLIAEEVEAVNADFVSYNQAGLVETVSYSQMIAPMIKAIQEQNEVIEQLKGEILLMKAEREEMLSRLSALEQ